MAATEEITRRMPAPRELPVRRGDILGQAFDALLAQERAAILFWASEYVTLNGRKFDGAFHDLRTLHEKMPERFKRIADYMALERDVGILRSQLCT